LKQASIFSTHYRILKTGFNAIAFFGVEVFLKFEAEREHGLSFDTIRSTIVSALDTKQKHYQSL